MAVFERLFSILENYERISQCFYAIGQILIVVNGQILNQRFNHLVTLTGVHATVTNSKKHQQQILMKALNGLKVKRHFPLSHSLLLAWQQNNFFVLFTTQFLNILVFIFELTSTT